MSLDRPSPWVASLLRHHAELLAGFSLLFILQAGLVPFDFIFDPSVRARQGFAPLPSGGTLLDITANLILYVPLGLFGHWVLSRRIGAWASFPLTIALAAAVSAGIEGLQAYSPLRICSSLDVLCNAIGATLGVLTSSSGRWLVPRVIGAALFEFKTRPAAAVLKAFCGLLLFIAASPFAFSFDANHVKQAFKHGVFTPFGTSLAETERHELAIAASDERTLTLIHAERLRRWARWAAEAASFAVLFWMMQGVLRGDYRFAPRSALALAWWLAGVFAIALSALQFFVMNRGLDVTDVVFRMLGVLAATGFGPRTGFAPAGTDRPAARSSPPPPIVRFATIALLAYVLYVGLIPFQFQSPPGGVFSPLSSSGFLPFRAYFASRFDNMLTDALQKFGAYALLAASLCMTWRRARSAGLGRRLIVVTGAGVMLSSIVETAQIFLPIRVVSLSDPIVAAVGCIVGVVLYDHAVRFARYAVTQEVLGPDEHPTPVSRAAGLTVVDQLLAVLGEPDPNAPSELGAIGTPQNPL